MEFAPFQKVPSDKKKPDARAGTIEQGAFCALRIAKMLLMIGIEEDYISFLQSLKDASTKPSDADTLETLGMIKTSVSLATSLRALSSRLDATRATTYHDATARGA